jgi:hypothetical protein
MSMHSKILKLDTTMKTKSVFPFKLKFTYELFVKRVLLSSKWRSLLWNEWRGEGGREVGRDSGGPVCNRHKKPGRAAKKKAERCDRLSQRVFFLPARVWLLTFFYLSVFLEEEPSDLFVVAIRGEYFPVF